MERLDERVIYQFFVPSPIVTISRCMTFDTFLEMTLTERELMLDGRFRTVYTAHDGSGSF